MRGIYFQGVNVVCIDGETRLDGTEPFAVGEQEFYDDMTKRAQKYNQ
jgi:hypothetical protein